MRDPGNILQIAALHPDYMGFIFYNGSPRFVGNYFSIPEEFPVEVKRVGVFVNESIEEILKFAKIHRLDFIQMHGSESAEHCRAVQQQDIGVIKTFSIHDGFDFDQLAAYKSVVDYFLFDTKGKFLGGNGVAFDWNVLRHYDQEVPFFLSGGISPDHARQFSSLEGLNVHALDVNSGVEESVGNKDAALVKKMKEF